MLTITSVVDEEKERRYYPDKVQVYRILPDPPDLGLSKHMSIKYSCKFCVVICLIITLISFHSKFILV
jgi:hypothetical protein